MNPKIDKSFNLVVTLDRDDDSGRLYVHSKPIPGDVFDRYYLIIARAFGEIYNSGMGGLTAAPRIAALMLRDIGKSMGMWDPQPGGDPGLLAHIRRLSHVIVPDGSGWGVVTLQEMLDKKALDEEDVSEVESVIAFFICGYAMHHRINRREILEAAVHPWSGRITSLNAMEFRDSLQTSIAAENSGVKAVSSVPR